MANTYVAIATTAVGSGGAANITFSSIPQTYTDLVVKVSGRSTGSGSLVDMQIRVGNGTVDTGSNYNYVELSALPYASIIAGGSGTTDKWNTVVNASSSTASTFGSVEIYIPNYTSSNAKTASTDAITENNSSTVQLRFQSWRWTGTSAINIITLTPSSGNFDQYSTATLYGIKNS